MITQQCKSIDVKSNVFIRRYMKCEPLILRSTIFFLSALILFGLEVFLTLEYSPDLGYLGHSIFEWVLACTLVWFTFVFMVHTKNCRYCDLKHNENLPKANDENIMLNYKLYKKRKWKMYYFFPRLPFLSFSHFVFSLFLIGFPVGNSLLFCYLSKEMLNTKIYL